MTEQFEKNNVLNSLHGPLFRYGVAPVTVLLSLTACTAFSPIPHDGALFLYFVPAALVITPPNTTTVPGSAKATAFVIWIFQLTPL
jgi:hypothetical protein